MLAESEQRYFLKMIGSIDFAFRKKPVRAIPLTGRLLLLRQFSYCAGGAAGFFAFLFGAGALRDWPFTAFSSTVVPSTT